MQSSRATASLTLRFALRHTMSPLSVFMLLEHSSAADQWQALPVCMLDRCSTNCRAASPELRSKATFFKLVLIALFTSTTAGLEVNHAF